MGFVPIEGITKLETLGTMSAVYDIDALWDGGCNGTDTVVAKEMISVGAEILPQFKSVPAERFELEFAKDEHGDLYIDTNPRDKDGYEYKYTTRGELFRWLVGSWGNILYYYDVDHYPVKEANGESDTVELLSPDFRECLASEPKNAAIYHQASVQGFFTAIDDLENRAENLAWLPK